MVIRHATPLEVGTLADLYAAFFLDDGISTPLQKIRTNLEMMLSDQRARIFVAIEAEKIVGFSSGTLTYGVEFGCTAELEDLYVIPSKRGCGLARSLAREVLNWAEQEGADGTSLVITVEAEQKQSLTRFYEKMGFANLERITMYHSS